MEIIFADDDLLEVASQELEVVYQAEFPIHLKSTVNRGRRRGYSDLRIRGGIILIHLSG